jgi:hypothetical protein
VHLVLALLLQSSHVITEPALPSRDELLAAYDQAAAGVTEIIDRLPERLGVRSDHPHLGFTMHTDELGTGPDGNPRRHTFVLAVFRGSPAHTAGIRPGDRIVAIGTVQCDTLKPNAVLFYLADHPVTVPFTLERDGKQFAVSVRRAPLPCAATTWRAFPEAQWRGRMTFLRDLIRAKRAAMASTTLTRDQTLQAMTDYQSTATLITGALEQMSGQLNPALSPQCSLLK